MLFWTVVGIVAYVSYIVASWKRPRPPYKLPPRTAVWLNTNAMLSTGDQRFEKAKAIFRCLMRDIEATYVAYHGEGPVTPISVDQLDEMLFVPMDVAKGAIAELKRQYERVVCIGIIAPLDPSAPRQWSTEGDFLEIYKDNDIIFLPLSMHKSHQTPLPFPVELLFRYGAGITVARIWDMQDNNAITTVQLASEIDSTTSAAAHVLGPAFSALVARELTYTWRDRFVYSALKRWGNVENMLREWALCLQ